MNARAGEGGCVISGWVVGHELPSALCAICCLYCVEFPHIFPSWILIWIGPTPCLMTVVMMRMMALFLNFMILVTDMRRT